MIAATRGWLDEAVIGLNLCPFAGRVAAHGRIRLQVSRARSVRTLLRDFAEELLLLAAADPARVETTLLIHPWVLGDFVAFNAFLGTAEMLLADLGLTGELQLASFHPRYRFAGSPAGDPAHCTNRSPFPTLHLLREASVEAALASFPNPSSIYRRNVRTLRRLGVDGYEQVVARYAGASAPAKRARHGGKP